MIYEREREKEEERLRDIRRLIIKDMKTTHACVHEKVDDKAKQRKRERESGSDREREFV